MAKRFSIRIQPRAEFDIDQIFSWLLERSPMGARNWTEALEQAFIRISDNPDSMSQSPEGDLVETAIRQCFFRTERPHLPNTLFA